MKQFLLLFFILTPFALFAQTFEWGQSYGLGSGNTGFDDRVSIVQYSEVLDKMVIAGNFYDSTDIEIGSSDFILSQEAEGTQGFIAVYSSDGELEYSKRIGSFINHIEFVNDSTYLVSGRFKGTFDFDRTDNSENTLTSQTIIGDGFLAKYHIDGSPFWIKQFTPGFAGGPIGLEISDDQVLVSCNTQDGFVFDPIGVNIAFETSIIGGGVFLALNLETGEIDWNKIINTNESQRLNDPELLDNGEEFLIGIRSEETSGLDIGINAPLVLDINSEVGLIVPIYSVSTQELVQYLVMETSYTQATISGLTVNSYGEIYISFANVSNSFQVKDFQGDEYQVDLSDGNENKLVLLKFNRDKELAWIYVNEHSDSFNIRDIQVGSDNDLFIYGMFSNTLITDQNTYSTSTSNNPYVQRIKADGSSEWVSFISNESGEITGTEFYISENNELFLGGYYQSNPNFIFANEGGSQTLGSNAADEGFFCKYNLGELAEQEAQVYLQTPYFDTIPEGQTLNSHIFISKLPAEAVEVTMTPDDQLDLGNGEGQPIVVGFDNSVPLSEQMIDISITAFDDQTVEDMFHTGIIEIEVTSDDIEFGSIEPFSEHLTVEDDDTDSVEETTQDRNRIAVYPNPATDEVMINYPQNLPGTTIDCIRIFDLNGRCILEIKSHLKGHSVSLNKLSRGSYILQVDSNGQKLNSKLIVH